MGNDLLEMLLVPLITTPSESRGDTLKIPGGRQIPDAKAECLTPNVKSAKPSPASSASVPPPMKMCVRPLALALAVKVTESTSEGASRARHQVLGEMGFKAILLIDPSRTVPGKGSKSS